MKSSIRLTGTMTAAFLAAATLVLAGGSAFAQQTSTASSAPQKLRNYRYCEVIPSVQSGSTVTSYIYNTTGFHHCPPGKWDKLTEQEVNEAFGSQKAQLNGPRYWVIDHAQSTGPQTGTGKTFTFGGIEMGLVGTLTTQAGQPTVGEQPYVVNEVNRDTIWTYDAGKPIFELTDPDGHVYVMQSYAQLVDKNLKYRDLPGLASLLTLPPGWSYSWQKLTHTLNLNSNGLAYVVNDNLFDSYQRIS
ncbi:MAG: hypothetical protein JO132_01530 [Streptosporangiaceae bacterium]|nr:hypothetical protein [Streptosporangiaceae bacterium]